MPNWCLDWCPSGAYAYPESTNGCDDSTPVWHFANWYSVPWDSTKESWVKDAFASLQDELSYNGTKLVTLTQQSGSGIAVSLRDVPINQSGAQYGLSDCPWLGTPQIWLNSNASTSPFYYQVARHEMFHEAGADHGGNKDSHDGRNPPTMATCINYSDFRTNNSLDEDAAGYLNYLHDSLAYNQLTANIGFERGTTYWGAVNGTLFEYSSGGATGPGHIGFKASSDVWSSYVYQTMSFWVGLLDNGLFRAKINAEAPKTGRTTETFTRLYTRAMTQSSGSNGCDYPNGINNPNDPTVASGWILEVGTGTTFVGTTWTAIASDWVYLPVADGQQVQVRAYGWAQDSGGSVRQIRFDNVRGEVR